MKKTFITTMPDHAGAFLKASQCFSSLGIKTTRVSYNKAVDSHTLFIEAEGTQEQLEQAGLELAQIGYLQDTDFGTRIILAEFHLSEETDSITPVLQLIHDFHFNISYISAQEESTDLKVFKMGLFVEEPQRFEAFMAAAKPFCHVQVIDYNHAEKVYDNSIFYTSFVAGLCQILKLPGDVKDELLVNTNLAMHTLDEKGLSPYKTFDSIQCFARLLAECRGQNFHPRITHHKITDHTKIILIEPPCGSNTAIIQSMGEYLFVDCGHALYAKEMTDIFRSLIPDFDTITKRVLVTHADLDHCGLLSQFDEVITSKRSAQCLALEHQGEYGFREQNPLHRPYINICKILTAYRPPNPRIVTGIWEAPATPDQPLVQAGFFRFGELNFEVYEGQGGHLSGEIALIDYTHHIAFTGDIYVNIQGFTEKQAAYNRHAPILMTSVDTTPSLCAIERRSILQRLGSGNWQIFGGHGYKKEYCVHTE